MFVGIALILIVLIGGFWAIKTIGQPWQFQTHDIPRKYRLKKGKTCQNI